MKSCAVVVVGLLVGCIVVAACGYFGGPGVKTAPTTSFIWVYTLPLSLCRPIVLPLLAVYTVLMMEAIGDIMATCDVSYLEVEGKLLDSRIQGAVPADGIDGILTGLYTITPMSTFT
jgi:NCS2 family nucleobase:cation symporter-2